PHDREFHCESDRLGNHFIVRSFGIDSWERNTELCLARIEKAFPGIPDGVRGTCALHDFGLRRYGSARISVVSLVAPATEPPPPSAPHRNCYGFDATRTDSFEVGKAFRRAHESGIYVDVSAARKTESLGCSVLCRRAVCRR